jgi:Carboxymuconolactone decarboxylase family
MPVATAMPSRRLDEVPLSQRCLKGPVTNYNSSASVCLPKYCANAKLRCQRQNRDSGSRRLTEDSMSRIPLVEAEHASPEVKALYEEIQREGFPVYNVMKMFANNAKCLAALVNFIHGIYNREAKLTPRLRELAYLRSSQLNSCHY